MKRSTKVLIASLSSIAILLGSVVVWYVMSSQPPPYQDVPLTNSDFEDYPSSFVASRSHGRLSDKHIAIASLNSTFENEIHQPARSVFLGLKLTGFHYNPPRKIGNLTYEGIVISRLDLLVLLSSSNGERPKIEELSLSCDFDTSLDAQIHPLITDPFVYNLQLVESINWYASPLEPFISWKGVDNYEAAGVIEYYPIDFVLVLHDNSPNPEFILTLTLVYSFDSSIKTSLSTSLYIAIQD